jgi:hypothetical protein
LKDIQLLTQQVVNREVRDSLPFFNINSIVIVAVGPQARGLTLTKRKLTIIEVLRHMCYFFLIKRVSTVRLSQGIPCLVSRRDTA